MEGYYPAGVSCSRCDFTCKTCNSSGATACKSCPTGWNFTGNSCTRLSTTTLKENWIANGISLTGANGAFTINQSLASNTATCGSFTWLFGFSTYSVTFPSGGSPTGSIVLNFLPVKLTYTSSTYSNGLHYGIHFRATFLFVDLW